MEGTSVEYSETTTVTLEWTLPGLKSIFESSKGDTKSKVTKSARFGADGRWQILFYANSGSNNGPENASHVSLYLSCEPTIEEKEAGANGKWVREGQYGFMFQIRPLGRGVVFNQKEARDRTFSSKSPNLGWGTFAHRDLVYYHAPTVRNADVFVITCTITSCGAPPAPPPTMAKQTVPRDLMNSIAALLDDPLYSDVEFVFPKSGQSIHSAKRLVAASKLLRRCDYFDTMFNSGFMETSQNGLLGANELDMSFSQDVGDSDLEDEDDSAEEGQGDDHPDDGETNIGILRTGPNSPVPGEHEEPDPDTEETSREALPKISLPSSPHRPRNLSLSQPLIGLPASATVGPRKMQVAVRDAAYSTYRAMINWIYTDNIVFAPFTSSFHESAPSESQPNDSIVSAATQTPAAEERASYNFPSRPSQLADTVSLPGPKTRKEWLEEWESANPGRPRPCSAKAMYRLADRLDLGDLKDRAFQHIVKSLTVTNIAYEVFSTFSATFDEVRKPMISFFLDNWSDVRNSEAMSHVWQQIRAGGHPGFEEVWPLIAQNLEFRPRTAEEAVGETSAPTV